MVASKLRQCSMSWLYNNGLDRYRRMLIAEHSSLFAIGVFFWIDSRSGSPNFGEDTWGSFAYSFPAEMWALISLSMSSMIIVGLVRPVKSWMVAFGSFVQCVNFLALSYSAVFTDGTVVIGLYASLYFLPKHTWMLVESFKNAP